MAAAPAGAAITQGTYTVINPEVSVPNGNTEGGYLSCPAGQRVLSEGFFWHVAGAPPDPANTHSARMASSTPTSDGLGMFSSGYSASTTLMRQSVLLCLPSSVIGTPYTTVVGDSPAGASSVAGGYLPCPGGQRIVSGGAFWHLPGQGPDPALGANSWITSSTPTTDTRGWYADGKNASLTPRVLTTVIHCLPDAGFNVVTTVAVKKNKKKKHRKRRTAHASKKKKKKKKHKKTRRVAHIGQFSLKTQDTAPAGVGASVGGGLACPAGERIVTGGAFWHVAGMGPSTSLADNRFLSSSSPTADAKGWYADAFNGGPTADAQLETVVLCIAPVAG
jgi:hypothetical protein